MTGAARWGRRLAVAAALLAAVIGVTWVLEHTMPPPYSGYLALVVVGLTAIQVFKRQPQQRARWMFRTYLRARARGATEPEARLHLLAQLYRSEDTRGAKAREAEGAWQGPSESDRAIAGVGALLARDGKSLDRDALAVAWDRERDRFTIEGWEAQPKAFVDQVLGRLDQREREQLDGLVSKYQLFRQRFFQRPTLLATEPTDSLTDFARLLHSMGNRLSKDNPGDAERAYRLSLRLRPDLNLAHAGLALLLEQTGRTREAAREAQLALEALGHYARRAADPAEPPTTEDISPFRSPTSLREALERVIASGS